MNSKRKAYIVLMKLLMAVSVIITCLLIVFLIVYIMYKGLPNISWELISTKPS